MTTDAQGNAIFSLPAPNSIANGQVISATATDATTGDTSEISDPITVGDAGTVQFSAATYSASENAGTATITVTRSGGTSGPLTVNYSTANGTAMAGQDYTSTSGVLTFAMGETSKTFTIPIADDAFNEANETVNLTLTTTTAGTVIGTQGTAVLTIVDNDPLPGLSVNSGSIVEGNSGTSDGTFTITLSAPSGQTVKVNYATADGTAIAPGDYSARSGTLTFAPGERTKTVAVPIIGDTIVEADETFTLTLSNPTNATLAPNGTVGTGTIVNDDIANVPPVANSQTVSTNEDTAVAITLSATDKETPAANLTYRLVSGPQNGTLTGTAPNIAYTPNANFNGSDSFTFVVNDGTDDSNLATVTLQVLAVNDAPVANAQQLGADNATPLPITLTASDVDNTDLTYFVGTDLPGSSEPADKGILPRYGTLSGTAPNLVYTPRPGFRGRDQFTFYVSDGTANSQQALVQIQVSGAAPVNAANDQFTLVLGPTDQVQQNGVTLLSTGVFQIAAPGVLANDRNPSGTKLTLRVVRNPQHGRFQLRQDGSVFYLPNTGFAGNDQFIYSLSDGKTMATAGVRLTVVDKRAPELRFDTPLNGATVEAVTLIKGRVRDKQSGLKALTLLWKRFDGKSWNGLAWVSGNIELPLAVQGIDWKYVGRLPKPGDNPDTDLLDGRYDLRVSATDKSNNVTRVTNVIKVENVEVEQPVFSDVRLSSAGASATQNAVVLRFTGALNPASASDAMNYAVTVNGVDIDSGEVTYSENTVTLSGFQFDEGDVIELEISNLRDAEGKALRDGSITVTAR